MNNDVLIIGAGVAGLAAAGEMARAGLRCMILEARPRCGGRIHTLRQPDSTPIELGAEFVHGKAPEIAKLEREHHLAKREVPDEHWKLKAGRFEPMRDFWGALAQVFDQIRSRFKDRSYCDFLDHVRGVSGEAKNLATDFVEGFHGANPKRISVKSISEAEAASEEIDGTKQFRFVAGYAELVNALEAIAKVRGVDVIHRCIVSRIEWERGHVTVSALHDEVLAHFEARVAVITLPVGVLQLGTVDFIPRIPKQQKAWESLAMGNVVKVNLQLRPGLWPGEKDGFVHLASERFPTWWKHRDVITAWAGGPRADTLAKLSSMDLMNAAIESLASLFAIGVDTARGFIGSAQFHDWRNDPFARGAYTYVPVGARRARDVLSRPVRNTIFFAGEATACAGLQGTVHGAVESGLRAARQVLRR
jgi:monoamine oxidase